MLASIQKGEIVPVGPNPPPTLCDALQTPRVSPITFSILDSRDAAIVSVNDLEVGEAVRWAWNEHKLVVEPGGAAALAALLSGKAEVEDGMAVVLSGGNIDPALHARLVA